MTPSNTTINTKQLRAALGTVVTRVRQGARYTVLHRSAPAFQIVPIDDAPPTTPLDADTLYHAVPVGRSTDGRTSADHDDILYRR